MDLIVQQKKKVICGLLMTTFKLACRDWLIVLWDNYHDKNYKILI
jgi:hypothetical protein